MSTDLAVITFEESLEALYLEVLRDQNITDSNMARLGFYTASINDIQEHPLGDHNLQYFAIDYLGMRIENISTEIRILMERPSKVLSSI